MLLKKNETSFRALEFCAKCVLGMCLEIFSSGCFSSYVVSVSPKIRASDIDKSKICPAIVDECPRRLICGCSPDHGWKYRYAIKDELSYVVSEGDRPGTATLSSMCDSVEHSENDWITLYNICTLGILPIPNDNDTISCSLGGRMKEEKFLLSGDVINFECRVYKCCSFFPTAYIPALIGFAMGGDVYVRFLGFGKDDVEFTASVFAEHVKKQAAAYLTKYGDKIPVRRKADQERADRIMRKKQRNASFRSYGLGINAMGGTAK